LFKKLLLKTHRIWSRLLPRFYYPYRFAGGRIYLDIGESRAMLARVLGRYERAKHQAIEALLPPGGTFIDVGVNKGDFSLLAARIVGDAGRVIAFEPEPTNCHWIRKSIALNGYRNIELHQLALSDCNGEAQLYIGAKSGWHSLVSDRERETEDRRTIRVATRTLDAFLAEQGWERRVDMIKVDVEGADMEVLRGASGVLERNPDIVLLVDIHPHQGVDPTELCGYLKAKGFTLLREQAPFDIAVDDCTGLGSVIARRR
jgi:FkbM family methyltransferase